MAQRDKRPLRAVSANTGVSLPWKQNPNARKWRGFSRRRRRDRETLNSWWFDLDLNRLPAIRAVLRTFSLRSDAR